MNDTDSDVLLTPGHMVTLAARGFARLSESRLKPMGFGIGYLPPLIVLSEGRADSQRDLARIVRIEQPSMAQLISRMERDGLIRRTVDPIDGRIRRLTLTDAALARLPEATAALFAGNCEALAGFSDEEAAQFVTLLERLIANLDRLTA